MAQSTAHLFAFADKRTHGVEDFFVSFNSKVNSKSASGWNNSSNIMFKG